MVPELLFRLILDGFGTVENEDYPGGQVGIVERFFANFLRALGAKDTRIS